MHLLVTETRSRIECSQVLQAGGLKPQLFPQLTASAHLRVFIRFQLSGGYLQQFIGDSIPVLLYQPDVSVGVDRNDGGGAGVLDDLALGPAAIRQLDLVHPQPDDPALKGQP